MNIISTLTIRHLLENKKRTIVTILGIVASTALITAILVGIFSVFKFFGSINRLTDGNVHAAFDNMTWEDLEALKNDDRIEFAGAVCSDPTITGIRLMNDKENRFRVGNIENGGLDFYKQVVIQEYEGRLPETSGEVAVEEAFLKDNGLELHPGDTITFELGNRYEIEPDGTKIYYGGSYRSEEQFEVLSTETCTITAILHGNRPTTAFDILRGMDAGTPIGVDDKGNSYLESRITLRKADHTSALQIRQIAKDYNLHISDLNTEFLISVFAVGGMGSAYVELFTLMGIALLIVVVTSVVLIYNAFGMSLTEKIKYLGMLASVGATKAQKRASIYFEGLVLGLVGIPLGIAAGIAGAAVTLAVLGRKILESDMIVGAEGMRGSVPIIINPYVIMAIVVISAITIFISALVPAIKASKIMPLDALRQTSTIKLKAGKLKVNPLIRKIFGYEGELAYKNIKRNGFKGAVIVFSMAISIIMFLTIDFFDKTFVKLNQYEIDLPFNIYVSCALDETDRLKEELEALPEVDRVVSADYVTYLFKDQEDKPDFVPANTGFLNKDYLTNDYKTLFDGLDSVMVVLVEDADFDKLLEANGINSDEYHGDALKGVILDSYLHEENGKPVFNEKIIGQKIFYDEAKGNPPVVEVSGIVKYDKKSYVCNLVPKNTVNVYVPVSMYYEKAQENIERGALSYTFGVFTTSDTEALAQKVSDITTYGGYSNCVVQNLSNARNAMDTVSLILNTAMYGFTILLTLIAIANIVNTISTAVHMRRQEFAMFRSVGMEQRGIKKMLLLETILYGVRALVIGIPVSILLSFLMFNTIESKIFAFELNYPMYFMMVIVVFVIIGLSMLLSASKIKDDSIIEALKCDVM
ncbi:ABC transporter permease [Butyrivibrio sp. VCD2006]|uniref:ABC transporter permease n=1 Tax=Butyrivibrio sp. VCD2006 TaxID=1280664 RepID=UPI0003F4D59A|nr:FtsX-like permease family protein [Butyrivibrio sp. VCD2006]